MASRLVLNSWAHWNLLPPPLEQHVFQWHLACLRPQVQFLTLGVRASQGFAKCSANRLILKSPREKEQPKPHFLCLPTMAHGHPLPFKEETKAFTISKDLILQRGKLSLLQITTVNNPHSPDLTTPASRDCLFLSGTLCLSYLPLPIEHRFDQSRVFCLVSSFFNPYPSCGLLDGFMQHLSFLSRTASELKGTRVHMWPGLAGHPRAYLKSQL